MKNQTICIIPARGGSKRIPHKNILEFKGKPILAYSIEAVKEAGIADVVMVSTDDEEIARIAQKYGAEVPFLRSSQNANDNSGIADVLIEVINRYKELEKKFDYVVCVLATAPLIRAKNIQEAYQLLTLSETADSICSVESFSYPPQRGLVMRNGELYMKNPENYYARSQDLEKIYHDCGQFFIFKTDALLRDKKLYTKHTLPFVLDEIESQDIDNETDWKIAELKYDLLYQGGKK